MDVLGINRYYGWYSNIGHLEIISQQLLNDLNSWRRKFQKPILVTEYGADSMVGLYAVRVLIDPGHVTCSFLQRTKLFLLGATE